MKTTQKKIYVVTNKLQHVAFNLHPHNRIFHKEKILNVDEIQYFEAFLGVGVNHALQIMSKNYSSRLGPEESLIIFPNSL